MEGNQALFAPALACFEVTVFLLCKNVRPHCNVVGGARALAVGTSASALNNIAQTMAELRQAITLMCGQLHIKYAFFLQKHYTN